MFTGYFDFAGREVGNAARAYAYATALSPAMGVLDPLRSEALLPVLENSSYTTPDADNAPWYDEDDPDTANFYGAYPLELTNLDSSTREAASTEGIADGGFISRPRQATREVLVRMALYGKDEMAVNAGLTWLRETLAEQRPSCSIHGSLCGTNDFSFLAARPTEGFDPVSGTFRFRRYLHGVGQTAPVVVLESREIGSKDGPCGFYARVEFAVTAENPEILHYPRVVNLPTPAGPVEVDEPADEIVNLAPHPSFEDFTTETTIRENLVEQPSGEGSVDDWAIFSSPGATVSATIGTIDPPTGAPFGRGLVRLFFTGVSGSSSHKVGLRYSIPVEEGKRYSFGVDTVIATVRQRMEMVIEWRTDTTTISSVFRSATTWTATPNVRKGGLKMENLVAPPFATRAWIRINTNLDGGGGAWPTGSALMLDGVMAAEGQTTPPFFDGSSEDFSDVEYVWNGGANNSKSRMQAPLPLGLLPAEDTFDGGAGAAFRTQQISLFGGSAGAYLWRDDQLVSDPCDFGMGGELSELAAVTPGLPYVASIFALTSRTMPVIARLLWFDGAGDIILVDALPEVVVGSMAWRRFAVDGVAPALSEFAAIQLRVQTASTSTGPYRRFKSGDYIFVDGAMVTQGPNLYGYFDGSTLTTGAFDYEWDGDPDSSTSRRVAFDPTEDDLVDPLLPPIMEPPRPPPIPDIALPADTTWGRISTTIDSADVFRWAKTYPIIRIQSDGGAARRVRVGLTSDPYDGTGDPQYIADIEHGFVVSYLPPDSVLTVDSSIRRAWIQIGGGPARSASSLLFGLDGGPIVWPVLGESLGYVLTVDTPLDEGSAIPVDVAVVRKE